MGKKDAGFSIMLSVPSRWLVLLGCIRRRGWLGRWLSQDLRGASLLSSALDNVHMLSTRYPSYFLPTYLEYGFLNVINICMSPQESKLPNRVVNCVMTPN